MLHIGVYKGGVWNRSRNNYLPLLSKKIFSELYLFNGLAHYGLMQVRNTFTVILYMICLWSCRVEKENLEIQGLKAHKWKAEKRTPWRAAFSCLCFCSTCIAFCSLTCYTAHFPGLFQVKPNWHGYQLGPISNMEK